jgi:hypothetical protein
MPVCSDVPVCMFRPVRYDLAIGAQGVAKGKELKDGRSPPIEPPLGVKYIMQPKAFSKSKRNGS